MSIDSTVVAIPGSPLLFGRPPTLRVLREVREAPAVLTLVPTARGEGPAVDRDRDARDERGHVAGQEQHDPGVVERVTEAAERDPAAEHLRVALAQHPF